MSAPAASARDTIQFTFPRIVLISPLCAICRKGCASDQRGIVFVEKRPVFYRWSRVARSGGVAASTVCGSRRWRLCVSGVDGVRRGVGAFEPPYRASTARRRRRDAIAATA